MIYLIIEIKNDMNQYGNNAKNINVNIQTTIVTTWWYLDN